MTTSILRQNLTQSYSPLSPQTKGNKGTEQKSKLDRIPGEGVFSSSELPEDTT